MKIYNIHERNIEAAPQVVGGLIDSLSTAGDRLWPREKWPALALDGPLGVGARGGHGPVRYTVFEYVPGQRVEFRFDETGLTAGLDGRHVFEVVGRRRNVVLRHVVDAQCSLSHWLKWQVLIRPMHDALLEDALDLAEREMLGRVNKPARWSLWTRLLRRLAAKPR
jgi:hypothetical protein